MLTLESGAVVGHGPGRRGPGISVNICIIQQGAWPGEGHAIATGRRKQIKKQAGARLQKTV